MHRLKLLIITIGIILSQLAYAEPKPGMVLVEPVNVIATEKDQNWVLLPYRERRPSWGGTVSLGYSTYDPLNYEPDYAPVTFSEVYGYTDIPMIELNFSFKKNMSIGSLGAELGIGMYENQSGNKAFGDSTLQLIPVRLGFVFAADALSPDPFLVPYLSGGVYTMIFNEEIGGNSHSGNTQAAPYFRGGVAISLDWIDRQGAVLAYRESGIESTYAYIELQKYMQADGVADGDFSNDISYAGGVRIEF